MNKRTPTTIDRLWPEGTHAISIPQAAQALSVGRTTIYEEIRAGRLESIKLGKRRLVPVAALTSWINERQSATMSEPRVLPPTANNPHQR